MLAHGLLFGGGENTSNDVNERIMNVSSISTSISDFASGSSGLAMLVVIPSFQD